MIRIFLPLLIFLGAGISASAHQPFYELQKDRPWIDSLRKVVQKVDKERMYDKASLMKTYMNGNMLLGNYYEKMYEKKQVPDLSQALVYYHAITDLGLFVGWDDYLPLMAVRNNLCRKVSSFYFFGKGIPKNTAKAIDYATRGMGSNKELFSFYSKRFFNSEETIQHVSKKNDSVYILKLNPFALKNVECFRLDKKRLEDISRSFSSRKFSGLYMHVIVYNRDNYSSYESADAAAQVIYDYMVKEFGIDAEHITYSGITNEKRMNTAYISFKKTNQID